MNATEAARLDAAIEAIAADPSRWKQDVWRCDTGMCLAGWIAELAGRRWVDGDPGSSVWREHLAVEEEDDPSGIEEMSVGGVVVGCGVHAAVRAARLIGLPYLQDGGLFDASNTLEDLRYLAAVIKGRHLTVD